MFILKPSHNFQNFVTDQSATEMDLEEGFEGGSLSDQEEMLCRKTVFKGELADYD